MEFAGTYNLNITNVGYVRLNVDTVDLNNNGTSSSFKYAIFDCQEGDVFTINGGSAGSAARLYGITDSEYNVLVTVPENYTANNLKVTIPSNGRYFIVNWYVYDESNVVTVSTTNKNAQAMINNSIECLTPEMYGAMGNGVNDDTVALQACINDAILKDLPVRGYNTYKISAPINIVGRYTNIYLHFIKCNRPECAIIMSGRYNYLYVDVVSYYNRIIKSYEEKEDAYYSKAINYEDKFGYLEITMLENKKYLIEIMYNYAKIEVMVEECDLGVAIANSITILSSINYNNEVLGNLINDNVLEFNEETFDIFETKKKKSNFLDVKTNNQNNEQKIKDPDLID